MAHRNIAITTTLMEISVPVAASMPLDFSITVKSRQAENHGNGGGNSPGGGLLKILGEATAAAAAVAVSSSSAFRVVTPKHKPDGKSTLQSSFESVNQYI